MLFARDGDGGYAARSGGLGSAKWRQAAYQRRVSVCQGNDLRSGRARRLRGNPPQGSAHGYNNRNEGISLATLTKPGAFQILTARGFIKMSWIMRLGDHNEVTFVDGDYVVAVVVSRRYFIGARQSFPFRNL